ncbi:hypothetical protein RB620_24615 [Paenibacillus sp. LHD-117]|uniref:hypothetical protein n=1 Tax=Paenibacillus sp. LHD-117 TaxID=3071412 RepID=UPI0027E21530|nr:hypothetical protein [Paenibacillus sp. LHD-117]MDQ6422620.1 hypothetical protein [Paenibacillus sp. LHD-117]
MRGQVLPAIEELLLRRPDSDLQVAAAADVPGAWPGAAGDRGAAAAPGGSGSEGRGRCGRS